MARIQKVPVPRCKAVGRPKERFFYNPWKLQKALKLLTCKDNYWLWEKKTSP